MSVEIPQTPHLSAYRQSSRSNQGQNGSDITHGRHKQHMVSRSTGTATTREPIMPVSTSSQSLLASLPSFMSVFGNGSDKLEVNGANTGGTQSTQSTNTFIHSKGSQQFSLPFTRRDSASTFESTESSPTTTISTIESTLTEPSPQSPPESPDSSLPLPSLKTLRAQSVPSTGIMEHARNEQFSTSFPTLPGLERGDSPNKKMRNMKNLSVNTSASNRHGPQLPKLGLSGQSSASHAFSAPPTPAFIVPPKVPRKKPSTLGLTITTPDASSNGQKTIERPSIVPQTPSDHQIRTLQALRTSVNAPLFSPTLAPEGGMRLPPFNSQHGSNRTRQPVNVSPQNSCDDTTSSPVTRQTLDHVQEEPDYELSLSQEVKSPAYPQGPVCIYDPFVYLYLEPTHIEARTFDVVLNVAREVKNPFTAAAAEQATETTNKDAERQAESGAEGDSVTGQDSALEPQIVVPGQFPEQPPDSVLKAAAEDKIETPPTTPKASRPEPEYVHIPWDHNTNVVDDLLRLCELIDSRAKQEKRVLVHCQCGVSRSASLVVAYGIYKNPQLTVQEAYDAVKNRSRWIGPNMNLIYQLSEFKTKLSKSQSTGTSAWHSWKSNLNSGRTDPISLLSPEPMSTFTSSALRNTPKTSFGASSQLSNETPIPRANSFSPPGSAQLAPKSTTGDITPGPSSAPPGMHFPQDGSSPEIEGAQKMLLDDSTINHPTPPKSIDAESNLVPTPDDEAIKEKEIGPTGAVAHDLQKVAKDLDPSEHTSVQNPAPEKVDFGNLASLGFPSTNGDTQRRDVDEPVSPTTILPPVKEQETAPKPKHPGSSPPLPAGFSSIRSRRQLPMALPLRQNNPPPIVSVQLPQKAFDPDVPPTPSLLSPRAAEFTASPFHRTAAGDLAGSSVFEQGLMSPRAQNEDPRSPAQRGEAPITRSIFDMI
ncbi:tyrosine/serine/threonine protein phosphatase [Lecanora helva]